jgi:hypothetical protein
MLNVVARLVLCLAIALPLVAQNPEQPPAPAEQTSGESPVPQFQEQESRRELRVITNSTTENRVAKFNAGGTAVVDTLSIFEAADGKVGIGTITPTNPLHILTTEGAVNAPLKLETNGADSISGLSLKNDARNWLLRVDGTDGDKFKIYDSTAAAYRLTINDIGQVGIRTTTPKATLHVYGDATSDVFMGFGFDPSAESAFNIGYGGNSFGRGAAFMNVRPDALATGVNPSLRFMTTNLERMIITNAGWVGIGTAQPAQKLHVFENSPVQTFALTENLSADPNAAALVRAKSNVATTSLIAHATTRTISRYGQVLGGWSELLSFQAQGLAIGTVDATPIIIGTSGYDRIHITPAGDVGIGVVAPTAKLHVAGNVIVTGTLTGAKVIGAVYQDLAEWVPATSDMEPGTVVILNPEINNEVMPSNGEYDTTVAGVVSAQPGILLGVAGDSKEQIATTGRVRVRVDATRSPIRIGDLLVTGAEPGTAMKSIPVEMSGISMHRPGTIIGKALEPLKSGVGEILVLLSLQ